MKKNILLSSIGLLLAVSLAACSGSVQLEMPKLEAAPESETGVEKPADEKSLSTPADANDLTSLQAAYISIYEKVLPSVVSISSTRTVTSPGFEMPEIPFDFDFDFESPQQDEPFEYQQSAAGSGFVWDTEGHIITNNHVVEGGDALRVDFADGRSVLAKLVGADAASDLAVLKVDLPANELVPISVTDSTKVKVGQIAIAIGNPFQLESSMTTGIISGVGRSLPLDTPAESGFYYTIPDVIQTDAAINPGNSGGVLVDINGSLIGVTTAIESPIRANSGVGYVIPSVIVEKIVPILIEDGKYQQPWIGISGKDMIPEYAELMDLDLNQRGALVIDVTANSPAEKAGLIGSSIEEKVNSVDVRVGGDVITAADKLPINDFEDLVAFLARHTVVGQTITLTVLRNGTLQDISLTLEARPSTAAEIEIAKSEEIDGGSWLGISGIDLSEEIAEAMDLSRNTEGVLIQTVTAESPADSAGLRGSYKPIDINGTEILIGGDIITAVDGKDISGMSDLAELLKSREPGDILKLSILRDGKSETISVTLGEIPD
jgi:serine protease Do